jgi:hypothetical protein
MGFRLGSAYTNALTNAALATSAETIIATLPAINIPIDNALILFEWYFTVTIGTAGVTFTVRLRRSALVTGTLVNVAAAETVVATNVKHFAGCYFDSPGISAEQQYVLTGQVGSASANSTLGDVALIAMCL